MVEELRNASIVFRSALDQYLTTILTIGSQCESGRTLDGPFKIIFDELEQCNSYELKIKQSRVALGKLVNNHPNITPINALPPEVLVRIFHLASPKSCYYLWSNKALLKSPSRSPDSLLCVCSHWRTVALGSHGLWAHIDLAPSNPLAKDFVRYGRLSAARSGRLPLHLHINLYGSCDPTEHERDLFDLCTSIAARTETLELLFPRSLGYIAIPMLEKFFANCGSKSLSRLIMKQHHDGPQGFIIANGDSAGFDAPGDHETWVMVGVSHRRLEKALLNVSVLRLDRVYLRWTSQAYHGLTKLHLRDSSGSFITASELAGVLNASPQLRFLHFGTAITEDSQPDPVRLDNLEVLDLKFKKPQHDIVLRLILPGSKPLRMTTIVCGGGSDFLTRSEHKRFLARSNIIQLDAVWSDRNTYATLDLPKLLELVPNLQVLCLNSFSLKLSPSVGDTVSPLGSRLVELRIRSSKADLDALRWVAGSYPALKLLIKESSFRISGVDLEAGTDGWKRSLAETFPAVEFVESVDLDGEDWD